MKITYNTNGHGFGPRGDAKLELTFHTRLVKNMEHIQVSLAHGNFGPLPHGMMVVPGKESSCRIIYAPRYMDEPSEITILSKDVLIDICKRFAVEVDKLEEDILNLGVFMGRATNLEFSTSIGTSRNVGEIFLNLGLYEDSLKKLHPEMATEEFSNCYMYASNCLVGKPSDLSKTTDEELLAIREMMMDKSVEEAYVSVAKDNIRHLNGMYRVFGNVDDNLKKIVIECKDDGKFKREIPFKNAKDLYELSKTFQNVWKVYELEAGVQTKEPTPEELAEDARRQEDAREERLVEERKIRKAKKDLDAQWEALVASFKIS
jgi:hypothetical protein